MENDFLCDRGMSEGVRFVQKPLNTTEAARAIGAALIQPVGA